VEEVVSSLPAGTDKRKVALFLERLLNLKGSVFTWQTVVAYLDFSRGAFHGAPLIKSWSEEQVAAAVRAFGSEMDRIIRELSTAEDFFVVANTLIGSVLDSLSGSVLESLTIEKAAYDDRYTACLFSLNGSRFAGFVSLTPAAGKLEREISERLGVRLDSSGTLMDTLSAVLYREDGGVFKLLEVVSLDLYGVLAEREITLSNFSSFGKQLSRKIASFFDLTAITSIASEARENLWN